MRRRDLVWKSLAIMAAICFAGLPARARGGSVSDGFTTTDFGSETARVWTHRDGRTAKLQLICFDGARARFRNEVGPCGSCAVADLSSLDRSYLRLCYAERANAASPRKKVNPPVHFASYAMADKPTLEKVQDAVEKSLASTVIQHELQSVDMEKANPVESKDGKFVLPITFSKGSKADPAQRQLVEKEIRAQVTQRLGLLVAEAESFAFAVEWVPGPDKKDVPPACCAPAALVPAAKK